MSCADGADGSRVRTLLCAGIAVLDQVFRLDRFPAPQAKARASAFAAVGGGCAANAAVAAARLGGRFGGIDGAPRRGEVAALLDGQISA